MTSPTEALKKTKGDHNPEDIPQQPNYNPPLAQVELVNTVKEHDPAADILAVRNLRGQLVNFLGQRGAPTDMREMAMLTGLLKDMDSSALGRMRITVDEKQADISEQNRMAVLAVLDHLTSARDAGHDLVPPPLSRSEPPVLPDDVQTREFVAGEAGQGTVQETFEQFQARTGEAIEMAKVDKDD